MQGSFQYVDMSCDSLNQELNSEVQMLINNKDSDNMQNKHKITLMAQKCHRF
jgi:hypothetical protein